MTALNFCLTENRLLLSMDTLASIGDAVKEPLLFTSKFCILPHMNCLICGVGSRDIVLEWYEFVLKKVVARGIISLDGITQKYLNSIVPNHLKDAYCTIYQFGINEFDDKMNGFVYRYENNYVSERIAYDIFIRPGLPNSIDIKLTNVYQYFSDIMKCQKMIEDSKIEEERIVIGGTVQILEMTKDKIMISNYDKFDDYDKSIEQIESKLST